MIHEVRVFDGKGKLIRTHTEETMKKRFWTNFAEGQYVLTPAARRKIVVKKEKQRIHDELYKGGPAKVRFDK